MVDLHPSEQHHWLVSHRDSALSRTLCTVAAWSLIAVGGFSNQAPVKIGSFFAGLTVAAAGSRSGRVASSTAAILQDSRDISDQSRQNRLYEAFKPFSSALVSVDYSEPLELFDWEQFKTSPNLFPHIMVEGSTGSGKTTLAEWLLFLLPGERLIITPKRRVSQWKGLKVVGVPLRFPDILKAFDLLTEEMFKRYSLMCKGFEDYPFLNFVVDEYPLIASNCDGISDQMLNLVRAAREADMRMILIAQGSEGKALDIEGQTSVRECFTRIRLGKFALDHAQKLRQPNLVAYLKKQPRPCMVDDLPAEVPDLAGFQIASPMEPASFPDAQDPPAPDPETSPEEKQVRELLSQGKTKKEIIWEVWKAKPGRGKDYAHAKREYERILRKQ